MTRPASAISLAPGPLVLAAMILLAAMSRWLPLPPNFAPIEAIALFGGAYFASRRMAVLVPVLAMVVSDLGLGLARGAVYLDYLTSAAYLPSLAANYLCVLATVALAFGLRGRVTGGRVLGYALAGSVLFFLVSNFAVWVTAFAVPGYPACSAGLVPCYVAALPFFKTTLISTLAYSALLFGGFALLRSRLPVLRAQTV
ncbi:hypothetical protein L599_001600000320 [Luteimonas sp. J16]|jgi:hypothetical protein|uniref:DUF6580 family putative transport protein n=1 Tax=unclassified Luteimonas TaxID=2629088 RepID=UPI0004B9CFE3|nr:MULTISPECIES: DUF6580 family putative transport protein [unclassified Luteimonas]TWG92984.1 hypothetical protein L599_001600000320 [Luteimonas sp. J16]